MCGPNDSVSDSAHHTHHDTIIHPLTTSPLSPAGLWSVEHAEALITIALRCVQQSPGLRPLLAEEIVPRLSFLADKALQIGSDQPEVGKTDLQGSARGR